VDGRSAKLAYIYRYTKTIYFGMRLFYSTDSDPLIIIMIFRIMGIVITCRDHQ
jgi:hypothetical protein